MLEESRFPPFLISTKTCFQLSDSQRLTWQLSQIHLQKKKDVCKFYARVNVTCFAALELR